MPPTSRGLLFLSIIRRHASTHAPSKSASKPKVLPQSPKPSPPSKNTHRPTVKPNPVADASSTEPSLSPIRSLFRTFFTSPRYRRLRRLILASPMLLLAVIHAPYDITGVNGHSMSPFFNPIDTSDPKRKMDTDERVLIQRWHVVPRDRRAERQRDQRPGQVQGSDEEDGGFYRGQLIAFRSPQQPKKLVLKRIVGLPGDVVRPQPKTRRLDGEHEDEEPVVVPWNHLWVEGDAGSAMSIDSNSYGPVSQNLIYGKVLARAKGWFSWSWIDSISGGWPAQREGRVMENAIMEAMVDPDAVHRNNGWTNGTIARVLERMRSRPEQMLYSFVNDAAMRQESRRLYNNALYVADIAQSGQEKELARDVVSEMEDLYGREALVFGIHMKRQPRERGHAPDMGSSGIGERATGVAVDPAATEAERWLRRQGWELKKNKDGTVRTKALD